MHAIKAMSNVTKVIISRGTAANTVLSFIKLVQKTALLCRFMQLSSKFYKKQVATQQF